MICSGIVLYHTLYYYSQRLNLFIDSDITKGASMMDMKTKTKPSVASFHTQPTLVPELY